MANWNGIRTGVISGRQSPATAERARQVKMTYVYQGHIEKIPILEEILADAKVSSDEVAYIGDDFTDIVIMHRVGFAVAVANARAEVKGEAHYVTSAAGGEGAVREVVELILKAQGLWAGILKHYELAEEKRLAIIPDDCRGIIPSPIRAQCAMCGRSLPGC